MTLIDESTKWFDSKRTLDRDGVKWIENNLGRNGVFRVQV